MNEEDPVNLDHKQSYFHVAKNEAGFPVRIHVDGIDVTRVYHSGAAGGATCTNI